jgi:hypothetical protein
MSSAVTGATLAAMCIVGVAASFFTTPADVKLQVGKILSATPHALIVFPDNRVWCIRNRGRIGETIFAIDPSVGKPQEYSIKELVLKERGIKVVNKADADWASYNKRYEAQKMALIQAPSADQE